MKFSQYFIPTLKEVPAEATIVSHRLMLRSGMIQQITSGIYAWLPLGLRVLKKVENIAREEQNKVGCLELLVPVLHPAFLWKKSGRYEDYGKEMLRMWDRHEREIVYGPTAEEVFTEIFRSHVQSYKDLPKRFYNIQWKFRDEIRPRFGVMRAREFLMKDAYSFDLTPQDARKSYKAIFEAYIRTFKQMELDVIPVKADTGPIGGDLSHEFQIIAETGESNLYYDERIQEAHEKGTLESYQKIYAVSDEKYDENTCPIPTERLKISRGIEVGHIFYFGTKYSIPMGATILSKEGKHIPVEMGSYGIGVSRLIGAIIEAFHDEKGIIWPLSVAPFHVGILTVQTNDLCTSLAETIYQILENAGIQVLYDDRKVSVGIKFADMDLIGIPYQIIIGSHHAKEEIIEMKHRKTGKIIFLPIHDILNWLKKEHKLNLL